jgi:tetratricopeptide (TPR) repeat protein
MRAGQELPEDSHVGDMRLVRFMSDSPAPICQISNELLNRIRDDLISRRIADGTECLQQHRDLLTSLDPRQPNSSQFVGCISQWVDTGWGDAAIVKELLSRFSLADRATLPLRDYVYLRLAEGLVASTEEETEKAIHHFNFIILVAEEVADLYLISLAHFWKARCHRKQGEYQKAMTHTVRATELALSQGYTRTAAVMQVLESWLYFQSDTLERAKEVLQEAEVVLRETDDTVSLGNIHSGYARIALHEGRYEQALRHFTEAIESYGTRDPRHRNLARSLAHIAYVKRLLAIRIAKKTDVAAEQRRRSGTVETGPAILPTLTLRHQVETLRQEAFSHLRHAERIYRLLRHYRGLGTVCIDRGLLFLDSGDVERASVAGEEAYKIGAEKNDRILVARALILQSMAESARYEEGIDEDGDPTLHAQRALDAATDALSLAKHTENRDLLASAYICRGLILCNGFFDDFDAAKECCDNAEKYLTSGRHDQVWEEHNTLKTRILRAGNVDTTLQQWSQGLIGNRTFRQITDEFADLVIPRVWEREGRKISRVAEKLSISRGRVRRILNRLGIQSEHSPDDSDTIVPPESRHRDRKNGRSSRG